MLTLGPVYPYYISIMLKHLAMLFVALCVAQASVPIPGKTANYPTAASSNIESQGQGHEAPAAPSLAVANAAQPPTPQGDSGEKGESDTGKAISVREFPPVSVTKDWADWGVWVFSGLLVVVGILQVWLLRGTLLAIQKQGSFAERTLKNSERANVLLEGASIELSPSGKFDGDSRVVLKCKNFGRTRASEVCFGLRMTVSGNNLRIHQVPSMVLGAGQEQLVAFQRFIEFMDKKTFDGIVAGQVTLRFVATICYQDIFGDRYTTIEAGVFDSGTFRFRAEQKVAG